MVLCKRWLIILTTLCLGGCADTTYYLQSAGGHQRMLQSARPLEQWLADASTAPPLRQRLALAQRIRDFGVSDLGLPDNASYRRYADLQRRAVVWNVVAAPEFSLALKTWCFPVTGCVAYRGYFEESEARAHAELLRAEGLEVSVYGVPAYSTLGWLNWLGGDPLLNTFIGYPEGELARMVFHELAHQVLYVKDDTEFNESFATAVERLGAEHWLTRHGSAQARAEYTRFDQRRQAFRRLCLDTRARLAEIYSQKTVLSHDSKALRAMKSEAMEQFRQTYRSLRQSWPQDGAYDAWVAAANNAAFGAQAAYDTRVPAFEALFEREGRNWPRFLEAARRLAAKPPTERRRALEDLAAASAGTS